MTAVRAAVDSCFATAVAANATTDSATTVCACFNGRPLSAAVRDPEALAAALRGLPLNPPLSVTLNPFHRHVWPQKYLTHVIIILSFLIFFIVWYFKIPIFAPI